MKTMFAFMLFCSIMSAKAELVNLVRDGDAESGKTENWSGVSVVTDDVKNGKKCFKSTAGKVISRELIPVSLDKKYELSAYIKAVNDADETIYFGLIPFDKDKHEISSYNVTKLPEKNTDTELVEKCSPESQNIKVKNASNWVTGNFRCIAFDIKKDSSDLPNYNISLPGVSKIQKKEGYWEVTLKKPCGKAYPAGTKVREHTASLDHIFIFLNKAVPDEWTLFSGKIKSGTHIKDFWPGTAFVKVVIYCNPPDSGILFDDITLKELK